MLSRAGNQRLKETLRALTTFRPNGLPEFEKAKRFRNYMRLLLKEQLKSASVLVYKNAFD